MSDDRLDVRKTYKLLINGAFPRSESGRSYEVTSAKGDVPRQRRPRVLARTCATPCVAARAAQAKWWNATAYNRGQVIYRLAEMAESRRDELAEHVALSEGVTQERQPEDGVGVDRSHGLVRRVDRQDRPGPRRDQSRGRTVLQLLDSRGERRGRRGLRPGVVTRRIRRRRTGADLCVGNTVVALASETRPTPAVLLGEMTSSSDFPAGVLNIVTGLTDELAPVLAAHEDVDGLDLSRRLARGGRRLGGARGAGSIKRVFRPHERRE